MIGFRFDGTLSERRLFSRNADSATVDYLSWNNVEMSEGDFLQAVYRALTSEGFSVTLPTSKQFAIEVTLAG